jgi:hypothetical protein
MFISYSMTLLGDLRACISYHKGEYNFNVEMLQSFLHQMNFNYKYVQSTPILGMVQPYE